MTDNPDTGQGDCIICIQLAARAVCAPCCAAVYCTKCAEDIKGKFDKCSKCKKTPFSWNQEVFLRKFNNEISPDIQFFVKKLTSGTITLTMKALDPCKMLFNRVQERQGISVSQMRLVVGAKHIEANDLCLREVGIEATTTVHLLARLKGGQ